MEFTVEDLKRGLNASYQRNKKAKKTLAKSGFELDKKLSGKRAKVFTDEAGNATIAYRGTSNFHDVLTDVSIPVGIVDKTKRVAHTRKIAQKVEDKYGTANAIGHSLGGLLADKSGVHGNIVTFNSAPSLSSKEGRIDIRTRGDLVSIMNKSTPKTTTINDFNKINFLDAHKIKHLNKLDQDMVLF